MAQQVGHFFEAGPILDQVTGQSVAQQMGSGAWYLDSAATQPVPNHLTDGLGTHRAGGPVKEEDLAVLANRTTSAQIIGNRPTDIGQERQLRWVAIFALFNPQGGFSPIKILQRQSGDFARTQAQSGQAQSDRQIAPVLSRRRVPTG
jgi:hypothetical protein